MTMKYDYALNTHHEETDLNVTQLGRLNLLTPRRRLAASKLIETGETINLECVKPWPSQSQPCLTSTSWSLNLPNPPAFGREPFEWKVKNLGPGGNDDVYHMNSQSGSQVSTSQLNGQQS